MPTAVSDARTAVRVSHHALHTLAARAFSSRGLPPERAERSAQALCYGDLTGMDSHGVANLIPLYLRLFDEGRADPAAEPRVLTDLGAAVLLDARGALGLWQATDAMDLAVERAAEFGVGAVSVRGATHLGCAGYHAKRAADHGMIGLVTSNCGRQRIARPPGGAVTLLGTNPLSLAAPAGQHPAFVLDMSTTAAPTGRVRAAARAGQRIPAGWLADARGTAVTDPAAFDRGAAHLLWLGAAPGGDGGFKGYGLGLMVEVLSAVLSGSGTGPAAEALAGDGRPQGRDDDIGYFALALAPALLRPDEDVHQGTESLFGALLDCPPSDPAHPVVYPGVPEARRSEERMAEGVPLDPAVYDGLRVLAAELGVAGFEASAAVNG